MGETALTGTTRPDRWRMLIGGQWVAAATGEWLDSYDPATGEPWTTIAAGGVEDVNRAVAAAKKAFEDGVWSSLLWSERGARVARLGQLVAANAEELSRLETRDTGKLLRETRALMSYVPRYYEYYAGLADKLEGRTFPVDKPELFVYSLREPLGVVAIVVPWNSSNFLTAVKLAPALVAGNTVVIKPSEHASAPILRLAQLCSEAGIPDGVVNVVTGSGGTVGAALCGHPSVRRIAFTGGEYAARQVVQATAANFARLSLELGGKSPNIVFADADLEDAVTGVIAGSLAASGQSCVAGSRVLVHRKVYREVLERLVARAEAVRIGDPTEPETEMGPIALRSQLANIEMMVNEARASGAVVACGGCRPSIGGNGWYYAPTVLHSADAARLAREEVFGPVVTVTSFDTEDEAVALANATRYGLAAGIWTSDLRRAHRVARSITAGIVWINTYRAASAVVPFGGRGASGYGMEAGMEGIDSYLATKAVWVNLSTSRMPDPFIMR